MAEISVARLPSYPEARCGFYYDDHWISPYLRVEFDLTVGRHLLEFDVYTPKFDEFDRCWLQVRMGLRPLFESEPMAPGHRHWHSIELPTIGAGVVSIVFRSSVRWRAPDPDRRVLGLVLPSLQCITERGDGFGIHSAA